METEVSPVRHALYRGDRDAALALVAGGAELNLFDAAALGDVDAVRLQLSADPDAVRAWSADGFTALHFAAFLGGAGAVRVLLDAGADVGAVARNEMRVQPLHSAVANGDVESTRLLLEAGADVDARQQDDYRPIDAAVMEGNDDLIGLLESYGATRPT